MILKNQKNDPHRRLNAISTLDVVINERMYPAEASKLLSIKSRFEFGKDLQTKPQVQLPLC